MVDETPHAAVVFVTNVTVSSDGKGNHCITADTLLIDICTPFLGYDGDQLISQLNCHPSIRHKHQLSEMNLTFRTSSDETISGNFPVGLAEANWGAQGIHRM